ncbi:MAG: protein-L-isoaspartate(D-aspartate) O-methyltransferase [Nitrospirae bacterium]|nr:protein-L-isoaspartate(D-aspartate) O-methyltransferase [Nitrospirota bacterium]
MKDKFKEKREEMVNTQLIRRGLVDTNVLRAMRETPRHIFAGSGNSDNAYADMALDIGMHQTISQPYMVAVMTELLELSRSDKVLEIGTGSGYQAAVLSAIVSTVCTVERIESLAEDARRKFSDLGYKNISVKIADGTLGWLEESPFDKIIITAAAPDIPAPIIKQLAPRGIIVAPVGDRRAQSLLKLVKDGAHVTKTYHVPCIFVPLLGKYGWDS